MNKCITINLIFDKKEKCKVLNLTQELIVVNSSRSAKGNKYINKTFPKEKTLGLVGFTGELFQTVQKAIKLILHKILQKIEKIFQYIL